MPLLEVSRQLQRQTAGPAGVVANADVGGEGGAPSPHFPSMWP